MSSKIHCKRSKQSQSDRESTRLMNIRCVAPQELKLCLRQLLISAAPHFDGDLKTMGHH